MNRSLFPILDRELKKGSAELLPLSLLETRRRQYEIEQLIESPQRQWLDKAGRRRRYYQLTWQGRKLLRGQRSTWKAFVAAISRIAGVRYA